MIDCIILFQDENVILFNLGPTFSVPQYLATESFAW
jgi:hypothetical protein